MSASADGPLVSECSFADGLPDNGHAKKTKF